MNKTRPSFQRGWVEKKTRKKGDPVFLLRWYVRDAGARSGWRKKSKVVECPNKKAALEELGRELKTVNHFNVSYRKSVSFSQFTEGLWANYLEIRKVKPSTRYSWDSMLRNYAVPYFGESRLQEITPADVTLFFSTLQKKQGTALSHQYQLNLYSLLRLMFEVAVEHELLDASPMRKKLHRPKSLDQYKIEKAVLSVTEIRAVLQEIPDYWKPLFVCDAVLSLRAGELLGLQWRDFDGEAKRLRIERSLWRGQLVRPKTRESSTDLPIPGHVFEVLKLHNARSAFTRPEDFMFCRKDGSPCDPDYLRRYVLYPAMDRAKIKRTPRAYGFHIFRHSAGTIVHGETGSLKLAQRQLRHSNISTTADIYVHPDEKEIQKAMETVANAILAPFCPPEALLPTSSGSEMVQ